MAHELFVYKNKNETLSRYISTFISLIFAENGGGDGGEGGKGYR